MEIVFDDKELDGLIERFSDMPVTSFLEELMQNAEAVVRAAYSSAVFTGNADFFTWMHINDNYVVLEVRGEDVGFLEFGAGISTDGSDIFANEVPFDVSQGSYSREVHGMYERTGYRFWYWGRKHLNTCIR